MGIERKSEPVQENFHKDTLLRVMPEGHIEMVKELVDRVGRGEEEGMIFTLSSKDVSEDSVETQGVFFVNRVPPAVIVKLLIENLGLSIADTVAILEQDSGEGEIIES